MKKGWGWDEPLFDPAEMGSIIPADPKKPFDVRKASGLNGRGLGFSQKEGETDSLALL